MRASRHLATALAASAAIFASLAPPSHASAQRPVEPGQEPADTFQLPEVVVTATRVPLHRDALATPVTVLTREGLQEAGIRTVAEALKTVPAVAVVRAGAPGAQTSLFLRGGEGDYVKVLIDGVPVNDAGGAIDLADLTTDQVERIEVVRGPTSVLYGSDAVAGVIQIFTRRGAGAPKIQVQSTGGIGSERLSDGSYGLADVDATLSGATGGVSYTLGGARTWSQGMYPYNSERDLTTGTARIGLAPRAGTAVSGFARYTGSQSHFPTSGSGELVDRNAYLDRGQLTAGIEASQRLSAGVEARLQLGLTDRSQVSIDEQDGPADTLGTYTSVLESSLLRRQADLHVNVDLPRSVATIGATLEWSEGGSSYQSDGQFGPYGAEASYDRSNRGYYAQMVSEPAAGLHLTLGARVDDNQVFGTYDTYRLGAAYELLNDTRIRAAYGTAFREPTFAESFGSGFGDAGNTGLEPERSESWEVGLEHDLGAARVAATWFDQSFQQLIQFTSSPPEPGAPNYFNVGQASADGLELTGETGRGRFSGRVSYTWLRTEVLDPGLATDAGFVQGEPLLRRPEHAGTVTGRVAFGDGVLGATLNLVGDRQDLDFSGFPAPRVTLDGYATLDLALEYTVLPGGVETDLLLRVDNLMDTDYESVSGFPGTGRVARLGVRMNMGL